ncbi:hypothetical protein HY623_03015 [Candidatus Uhrbacteria bacterium]|nr:hypothetical protein [Candidatus Uhrbacteria bacterium]
MNYFLIPGRLPSLSLLELCAVLSHNGGSLALDRAGSEAIPFSFDGVLDTVPLIHRLGGAIKGGRVMGSTKKDFSCAAAYITNDLLGRSTAAHERITFGVSAYSVSQKPLKGNEARRIALWIQREGIALKKCLREHGVSARFVAPQHGATALSSVVVEKNHLVTEPNVEYVLLIDNDTIDIGITAAVQEFEEYARRDYGRPHRDMKTGLLPPKLARIMINLARAEKDASLLDPFCGLGTVLQEALLLEYTNVSGSDIDEKNVGATKENISWLKKWGLAQTGSGSVFAAAKSVPDPVCVSVKHCDAQKLASCFPKRSIGAIVTEPTLGPALSARHQHVSEKEIDALCDLYIQSFRSFHEALARAGRVVIVFPVWMADSRQRHIPCLNALMKQGFINVTVPDSLRRVLSGVTERGSLVISRPDARVARELFVFEKVTR